MGSYKEEEAPTGGPSARRISNNRKARHTSWIPTPSPRSRQPSIVMPRITPCRLLKLLFIPWILFILWMFLPSPIIAPEQRAAYIQNTLASGRSLISVVDYRPFRRDPHAIYSGECSECSSLLFHWRLVNTDNNILLYLNEHETKWDAARFNITGILDDAKQWNVEQRDRYGKEWTPYFTDSLKLPQISAGNDDEEINMPWFAAADKNLFHYDMHGFTVSPINLRAIVPEPGVIEIWNSAIVREIINRTLDQDSEDGSMKGQHMFRAWEVLHTPYLRKIGQDAGLLATFMVPDAATIGSIVVEGLKGELPSRTYPIRKALLFPLGPFISVVFLVVGELSDLIAPVFPLIILAIVIYILYRLTRCVLGSKARLRNEKKHVWGPTGPVEVKSRGNWFDEEKGFGVQRPQTVRLGRSWKV